MGVYISRVEEGSVAERAGLRPGDTILEVNGTPFRAVTHEEALKVSPTFSLLSPPLPPAPPPLTRLARRNPRDSTRCLDRCRSISVRF